MTSEQGNETVGAGGESATRRFGKPSMSKPLLIVLVVILVGMAAYWGLRAEPDTSPVIETEEPRPDDFMGLQGGTTVDFADADFDVQVATKIVGSRKVLEFIITESHGWGANGVYIRFWHQVQNDETGEWEKDPSFTPGEMLCKKPLLFGEPLESETTLTALELNQIPGGIGDSSEWAAEVYRVLEVRAPDETQDVTASDKDE